jgi:hypothetical protein
VNITRKLNYELQVWTEHAEQKMKIRNEYALDSEKLRKMATSKKQVLCVCVCARARARACFFCVFDLFKDADSSSHHTDK